VSIALSFLIFLIVQIVVVDLGEEVLLAGLSSPDVGVAVGLNYITWTYAATAIASSIAANVVFYGRRAFMPALMASACTVVILYFVGFGAFTVTYPGITLNLVGMASAPTLFLSYVLRDTFTFQFIVIAIQVTFFTAFNAILVRE
jgi:hypothetical protein